MRKLLFLAAVACVASPALAQEKEDFSAAVALIKGGAVYDEKIGIDGSLVSEAYQLTHLTCSTGSRKVRVLMPVPKDAADEAETTLRQVKGQWQIGIQAYGKVYRKDVTFKPVRDPISQYSEQAEITVEFGDPLWRALTDAKGDAFLAEAGGFGAYVSVGGTPEFKRFLAACKLSS
jgi:hypothetical protein